MIAGRYAQDQGVVAEECNPYTGKVMKFYVHGYILLQNIINQTSHEVIHVTLELINSLLQNDPCNTDSSCARTFVSDYEYLGGYYGACNEERMLQTLVEKGPLAVAYAVYDDFPNYDGGIYHHTGERNYFNPLEVGDRWREESDMKN